MDNGKWKIIMKAELIIPLEALKGALRKDGYYFRMYKGQQIVQRCPTKWQDTPARKAAREKFIEKYGKKKSKGERLMAKGEGERTTSALSRGAEDELRNRHIMPDE
jgi:hypothetical protein